MTLKEKIARAKKVEYLRSEMRIVEEEIGKNRMFKETWVKRLLNLKAELEVI